MKKPIKDHLGHTFKNLISLASAYNIEPNRLRKRLDAGWDIERALKTPIKENPYDKPIQAPNGITYPNTKTMCQAYKVPYNRFITRYTKRGWSLQDSLRSDKFSGDFIPGRDHLGKIYPSQSAMARAWGIPPNSFLTRLDAGWSIKKALTTPIRKSKDKKGGAIKLKSEYDSGLD